jgi:N6-adenosine-specific RNA methylase IME4
MNDLVKYDAACAALSEAVTANEVMAVRLTAQGIEAVGRVARNLDWEIKGARLRIDAEAKLGQMLDEGERQGIIAPRGRPQKDSGAESFSPAKLSEIGIDGKLSAQARRIGNISERARKAMLDRMEEESRKRGRIANDVILSELRTRNTESRRRLAQELSDCAALHPSGRKFPVIYADPAWRRKAGIGDRAYENQYVTMSWNKILAMPVAQRVLPDAWLFLWIPRAHLLALHPTEIDTPIGRTTVKLPLAWAVAQAWGFDAYSTCSVWTKTDEDNPDDHGTGLIFWDQDEILCLFKRGRGLPMPSGVEKVGSNYRAPAGRHSAKPAYYRDVINRMTGGVPVLELFAREDDEHPLPANFFTWGNQSKNTAESIPLDSSGYPLKHDEDGVVTIS